MNSLVKKEDLEAFKKMAETPSGLRESQFEKKNTLTIKNMRKKWSQVLMPSACIEPGADK